MNGKMKRDFTARFSKDGMGMEQSSMRCARRIFINSMVLFCLVLMTFSCQKAKDQDAWLSDLHDEARALFYQTLNKEISVHPKRSQLNSEEMAKIVEAETRYKRLFDILINIFYQKDEPQYSRLLEINNKESRSLCTNSGMGTLRMTHPISFSPNVFWLLRYTELSTMATTSSVSARPDLASIRII